MLARGLVMIALAGGWWGCGGDLSSGDDDGPLGGSNTVTGSVIDFQTGAKVPGSASVSTAGVQAPVVTAQGADFTIEGIPDNSTFQILASVAGTHHATFGPAIEVLVGDLTGIETPAIAEPFLNDLAAALQLNPSATKGILLAKLVDKATGMPKAGVPKDQLVLGTATPFFLDANLAGDKNATVSSASGFVVFFDVDPGVVELGQAAAPTVTLAMAASPITAATVTVATIEVTAGAPMEPTNVSFSTQIAPIFQNRGCVACHSGGGIGKDLGGLTLDGGLNKIYMELVDEDPLRVQTGTPLASLLLRMPSREDPPDTHPNVTFASSDDPDYVTILVWIKEGAKNN